MAITACTEYFEVIDKGCNVPRSWRVAGFAQVTGAHVALRLGWNRGKVVVVAVDAAR